MNQEAILEKVGELIQHQNEITFTEPPPDKEQNALGVLISKLVGYEPKAIIKILLYALEDSNDHEMVEKIEKETGVKI